MVGDKIERSTGREKEKDNTEILFEESREDLGEAEKTRLDSLKYFGRVVKSLVMMWYWGE